MSECGKCDGSGFTHEMRGSNSYVVECECRKGKKLAQMLEKAGLPERYQAASFENFEKGSSASIQQAVRNAGRYADEFLMHKDRGLLFYGSVGTGKTHLSIAVLRRLTLDYGVRTCFVDFRVLLKRLQATMRNSAAARREEVLQPILDAEALVLDEIGAARPTDWTFEIAEEILNHRYNEALATILTTNLPNQPCAAERTTEGAGYGRMALMEQESLGDRIGTRMYSRVQQMCVAIEMQGADYRRKN